MDKKRLIREKYFLKRKRFFFEIKQTYFQPLINVIKKNNNKAFFITALSLTLKENHHIIFIGKINGTVSLEPKGFNGFGYDPIFIPNGKKITFGQMKSYQKYKIDHRARAFKNIKKFL